VPNATLQEQFQRALSYREKARRLRTALEEAYKTGGIAPSRYENEFAVYSDHIAVADRMIEDLRLGELPRLAAEGRKLQRLLQTRGRIAAGKFRMGAAWRTRRLDRRIARCREAIATYNTLIAAKEPGAVGGFLDLPLDQYRAAPPRREREFSLTRSNLKLMGMALVLLVTAVAVTFLVLLPGSGLNVTATRVSGETDIVLLACVNAGGRAVTLRVPWDDARNQATGDVFGIDVFIQDAEKGDFRLWPDSSGVWYYEGRPARFHDPIIIPPLLRVELRLDLGQLRRFQPEAKLAKVVVSDADGDPVFNAVYHL